MGNKWLNKHIPTAREKRVRKGILKALLTCEELTGNEIKRMVKGSTLVIAEQLLALVDSGEVDRRARASSKGGGHLYSLGRIGEMLGDDERVAKPRERDYDSSPESKELDDQSVGYDEHQEPGQITSPLPSAFPPIVSSIEISKELSDKDLCVSFVNGQPCRNQTEPGSIWCGACRERTLSLLK